MKLQTGLLGWALVAGISVVAACGGSSNEGGNNDGGAGKAGSATAGSRSSAGNGGAGTGSGGSRATGGSTTAGTSAGGRDVGGSPGTGGFNLGGEGFDPSEFACESPPEMGSACEANAQPCLNGTDVCYCNMSKWTCMSALGGGGAGGTGPIGDIECPAAKPTAGTPCGDSAGFCPYGGGAFSGCACYNGSWACL